MTSAANAATAAYLDSHGFVAVSQTAGVAMAVLLLALLVGKELARITGRGGDPAALRVWDVAIGPLLLGVGVVVVARFWALV